MARKGKRAGRSASEKGSSQARHRSITRSSSVASHTPEARKPNGNGNGVRPTPYDRTVHALSLHRRGIPLPQAARRAGTTIAAIQHHHPGVVKRTRSGEWSVAKGDRSPRTMPVLTTLGDQTKIIRGSGVASINGQYRQTAFDYLRGKATQADLDKFHGKRVAGVALITDGDLIEALADGGAIRIDEWYAELGGAA